MTSMIKLIISCIFVLTMIGCSNPLTQKEIDEKIAKCNSVGMSYAPIKDYKGGIIEIMCAANKPNINPNK